MMSVLGAKLLRELVNAGVVPLACQRVVIDIPIRGIVKVYSQNVANDKLLKVNLAAMLAESEDDPVVVIDAGPPT